MRTIYFYCSSSYSPVGYQFTVADTEKREFVKRMPPNPVKKYFTRGGAEIIYGYNEEIDRLIFLLKGIRGNKSGNGVDEQGREVYINLAFEEDKSNLIYMNRLAAYVLANYESFGRKIANLLILKENETGYDVNFDMLNGFLREVESFNERMKNPGSIIWPPNNNSLQNVINRLCSGSQSYSSKFYFVVLSRNIEYFCESYGIPASIRIENPMPRTEFSQSIGLVREPEVQYVKQDNPRAAAGKDSPGEKSIVNTKIPDSEPPQKLDIAEAEGCDRDNPGRQSKKFKAEAEEEDISPGQYRVRLIKSPSKSQKDKDLIIKIGAAGALLISALILYWIFKK